ncbi:MAG TPA: MASE3 domain-containing protein [Pseudobacteroides sp.]|uniref:sensor histidine kinase n=1 Tax=Pseudobacteroides sp. TaxID=1968840 RepID=UPI002F95DEB2
MGLDRYKKLHYEIYKKPSAWSFILKNILLLLVAWILADILTPGIWSSNIGLFHTIFELLCVFISLSIFIILWYTYDNSSYENRIIGFAFLSVAIFNCFHILYFIPLNFTPNGYDDLFVRFGVASRLTEAIFLLNVIYGFIRLNVNKWVLLTITFIGTISVSLTILWFPGLFPKLLTVEGATVYRVILESIIIILFILCLQPLMKNVNRTEVLTYKYILSAIIIAIPVEVFFSIYDNISSFYNALGHSLKIISYCLLFKGIFISAVTYPYRTKVEELNISEERFRNAFEYAAVGMAVIGLDGKWLKVNGAICDITGYIKEELQKGMLENIIHPEDVKSYIDYTMQLLQGKIGYYHMEKRFIHKNGYPVWVLLSGSLVRDNTGCPIYFVMQIQDITELKKAYDTIEFDRLRTEFFANISHEFRTPLNIILNSIQLFDVYLKNYPDNSKSRSLLSSMRQNCSRLIRLINNIIDTTRIDAGFYSLNKVNCNIVNVVEEVIFSVAEFIKSKGLQLEFDTNTEEKLIDCDPDKIERIMLNLLSNAVKFTKKNGKITVNIHDKEDETVISVKDNGIGIEKDKQNLIFQRFRQVDKSLTRSHEGSGIGLSLVKALVELHGGTIKVESEYGKGSEFIITLPTPVICTESVRNVTDDVAVTSGRPMESRVETINVEFSDIYF